MRDSTCNAMLCYTSRTPCAHLIHCAVSSDAAIGGFKLSVSACRYTLFIVLYPIGVVAEMTIMVQSLTYLKSQKLNSISLPNAFNFGFNYHLFIKVHFTQLIAVIYVTYAECHACRMWSGL